MQHRALLFGIIGGFVWFSLFMAKSRQAALLMIGVPMIGFNMLMLITGAVHAEIMNVVRVDVAGVFYLVFSLWMKATSKRDSHVY